MFLRMVYIFTHPKGWGFIARDPVYKLTVSQYVSIQSQAQGL